MDPKSDLGSAFLFQVSKQRYQFETMQKVWRDYFVIENILRLNCNLSQSSRAKMLICSFYFYTGQELKVWIVRTANRRL